MKTILVALALALAIASPARAGNDEAAVGLVMATMYDGLCAKFRITAHGHDVIDRELDRVGIDAKMKAQATIEHDMNTRGFKSFCEMARISGVETFIDRVNGGDDR